MSTKTIKFRKSYVSKKGGFFDAKETWLNRKIPTKENEIHITRRSGILKFRGNVELGDVYIDIKKPLFCYKDINDENY